MRWIPALLLFAACATARPVAAPVLRFEMSAADVKAACDDAERAQDAALDAIVRIPARARTFANTVVALEDASATYNEAISRVSLFTEIHPDAAVREAARVCDLQSGLYAARVSARHDVYLAVREVAEHAERLGAQDQRLLDLTMRDFRLEGQGLDDPRRAELLALRTRFSNLAASYYERLDNVHETVEVDASELSGMPEDFDLWNAVLASDLLTRFRARGVLDPEVGMAYRKQILDRGSREDQIVQLRGVLGRDPDERAFIESL